ncbi:uncharacterized protein LOC110103692, partial [Dendrobium catenatum]|uniref:uncharacterized protein LOC110103692 n=1 Tax=Dendrobium catenatum TaxID=906689 RepID=UPI0009F382BE
MEFISNGAWILPDGWPLDIKRKILSISVEEVYGVDWAGFSKPSFKNFTSQFYDNLDDVSWFKFIWHKQNALRYACYAWMAINGKLKCADKLIVRGIPASPICDFCRGHNESHSHLFFSCDFTFSVISSLLPALNCFYFRPNLYQAFDYFNCNANFNAMEKNCCFLAISVAVYYLWRERNVRRFSNSWNSPDYLKTVISSAIRAKIGISGVNPFLGCSWMVGFPLVPMKSGIAGLPASSVLMLLALLVHSSLANLFRSRCSSLSWTMMKLPDPLDGLWATRDL